MPNSDCECALAEAESAKSEAEEYKADMSSGVNEPELSLLDDILSVESGGLTSRLDENSEGGGQQQQVTSSDMIRSCCCGVAMQSACFVVGCTFLLKVYQLAGLGYNWR